VTRRIVRRVSTRPTIGGTSLSEAKGVVQHGQPRRVRETHHRMFQSGDHIGAFHAPYDFSGEKEDVMKLNPPSTGPAWTRRLNAHFIPVPRPSSPAPRGFTLVELLVVITIIGILIALLLPAVQAAREAARKVQCANNFKQVGLALHHYHASIECFPPGEIEWANDAGKCGPHPTNPSWYFGVGWGTLLLPHLEQQAVYDRFDFSFLNQFYVYQPGGGINGSASRTRIAVYLCPSDPQGGECIGVSSADPPDACALEEGGLRQSNMAGVIDSQDRMCYTLSTHAQVVLHFSLSDGIMANLQPCRIRDISDGTSNTLMIGEVTGQGKGSYRGFCWAHVGIAETANGINGPGTVPGGGTGSSFYTSGFSSFHPGGCHFLMADGSVQFLSQNIYQNLLVALTTRAGGEVVSGSAY